MSDAAYFEQLELKINHLVNEEKYKEAYLLCANFLEKFPDEERFVNLQKKIEKKVEEKNAEIVEKKIKELKSKYKEGKYVEILQEIKKLFIIAPENKKLTEFQQTVQYAYRKQIDALQKNFNKQQNERLTKLFNENPDKLLDEIFQLEFNNQGNNDIKKLADIFKKKVIERKIKEKKDLLNSDKFDAIENFIKELKKIDANNPEIHEIENTIKKRKHNSQIDTTTEFVYKGENYLDTLMKLGKYDKAIQTAEEVLKIDSGNKIIKKFLKKAKSKFFTQTKNETIKEIHENLPQLNKDYQKDKNKFISI